MSSSILRKTEKLTLTTPIPLFIPQSLAISVLHDHSEIINLNPLVTDHVQITPPKITPQEEYCSCIWYNIAERIQYVPGLGKIGSGKISFQGCFRDTSDGLWTHIYAPMNVDLKVVYRVVSMTGNQCGKLALKADVQFECNVTLAAFVRTQLKTTIKHMVDRMMEKAEKADAEALATIIREHETAGEMQKGTSIRRTDAQSTRRPHLVPGKTAQAVSAGKAETSPVRKMDVKPVAVSSMSPALVELPSATLRARVVGTPAPSKPYLVAELPDNSFGTSRFKSLHVTNRDITYNFDAQHEHNSRPQRPLTTKTGGPSPTYTAYSAPYNRPASLVHDYPSQSAVRY